MSIHEQVRFPPIVDGSHKVTDKHHMIRPDRLPEERHLGLRRSSIPLLIVAAHTRANEILPGFFPSACFGNNMIHGQRNVSAAAILAFVAVAAKDVLPGEDNLFEGNADVDREANDAWKRHRYGDGSEQLSIQSCYEFGFTEIEQYDCLLDVANAEWLVVLVQHEHFAGHFPVRACTINRCAEVSNTSLWLAGQAY